MSTFYQNVKGLNTKLPNFYCESLCEEYCVIIFTETWLSEEVNSNKLFDNRYVVFGTDRNNQQQYEKTCL